MDEYESLSHSKWECIPRCIHSQMPSQDVVQGTSAALGRVIPAPRRAETKPDRRGSSDAGPRAHDDLNSAQVRGVGSGGIHQGQECDPPCAGVWRAQAEFRRSALLGAGIHGLHGGPRRSRDSRVHSQPREGRPATGPAQPVEVTSHRQGGPT
jgi:hypothetical protein